MNFDEFKKQYCIMCGSQRCPATDEAITSCGYFKDENQPKNDVDTNQTQINDKVISTNNIIKYNGYKAKIEYSADDNTLYGQVIDVDDLILFEIENVSEAKNIFRKVVDEYVDMKCRQKG